MTSPSSSKLGECEQELYHCPLPSSRSTSRPPNLPSQLTWSRSNSERRTRLSRSSCCWQISAWRPRSKRHSLRLLSCGETDAMSLSTGLSDRRRHGEPPKTNFEALQDILKKRRGMELDVSSSKALAESLDACTVSFYTFLLKLAHYSRTPLCPSSTPLCGSWRLDACSLQSTLAQGACRRRHTGTTDSPHRSTLISQYVRSHTLSLFELTTLSLLSGDMPMSWSIVNYQRPSTTLRSTPPFNQNRT